MTSGTSGAPGTARRRGALSPEGVGGLLTVAIVVLAGIALLGPIGGGPGGAGSRSPSPAPSTAIATASGSTSIAVSPSPTPGPTLVSWAAEAAALLAADGPIMERRDRLAEVGADVATSEIATQLRAMNSAVTFSLTIVDRLDRTGAPDGLVSDARRAHQAILDESLDTLDASIRDRRAFVEGATQVVALTAELEAVLERVRATAGLPAES